MRYLLYYSGLEPNPKYRQGVLYILNLLGFPFLRQGLATLESAKYSPIFSAKFFVVNLFFNSLINLKFILALDGFRTTSNDQAYLLLQFLNQCPAQCQNPPASEELW